MIFKWCFFILILICIGICGCDEGSLNPTEIVDVISDLDTTLTVISPPPDYVFDVALAPRREANIKTWKNLYNAFPDGEFTRRLEEYVLKGRSIEELEEILLSMQKEFYTKFVDAAGIAVLSEDIVPDRWIIEAAEVVIVMTAKHPKLRERLTMENGFYMILLDRHTSDWDIPEIIGGAGFEYSNTLQYRWRTWILFCSSTFTIR